MKKKIGFDYDLYEWFVNKLKENNLYDMFIKEYGNKFVADNWYYSGWWFENDTIYYRCCDLYDDWGWRPIDDVFCYDDFTCKINEMLNREGYYIAYEGNDEEDFLVYWEK